MAETLTHPVVDTEAWEYAVLDLGKIGKPFLNQINDLDVDGWHLVNVIAYSGGYLDKLGGMFRRAIVPLPAPMHSEPGWYDDPSGRHQARYWNGQAWTHAVGDDGKQGRDAPTQLPPTEVLVQQQ